MPLHCPLCFDEIKQGSSLIRVCLQHRQGELLVDDYERLLCPRDPTRDLCNSIKHFQQGVFILHVGCREENPFWDQAKAAVSVPPVPSRGGHNLHHWMFGALTELATFEPARKEMWFPLSLARTVNRLRAGDTSSSGRVVKLLGATGAGKTVLAYMALSGLHSRSKHHASDTYVHISPDLTDPKIRADEFVKALLPLSLLAQGDSAPEWIPFTTSKRRANIRAGLFAYEKAASMGKDILRGFGIGARSPLLLAFYDNAGEDVTAAFDQTSAINRLTDLAVVVLDSSRFGCFTGSPNDDAFAMHAAKRQLQTFERSHARRAIVVTQLDRAECSKEIINLVREEKIDGVRARSLLMEWLATHHGTSEYNLGQYLQAQNNVDVFFVSTEGLEADALGPGKLPKPHGIGQFIDWCLADSRGVGD
jgi:hypothetical protein